MPEGRKEEKKENEERQETKEEVPKENEEELRERLLRLAAEFDNYKKRISKDIENSRSVGKAELASKLLPILDEFELAVKNFDMKNEHEKGLAIVLSNFVDVLKKEGLKEIEAIGVYDPYRHEIMMTKEAKEKEGTILDVVRKGYFWNNIMLRPASVIVSKGSKEQEKTKKEEL